MYIYIYTYIYIYVEHLRGVVFCNICLHGACGGYLTARCKDGQWSSCELLAVGLFLHAVLPHWTAAELCRVALCCLSGLPISTLHVLRSSRSRFGGPRA